MKNYIYLSIAFIITALIVSSSCTKETIEKTVYKDTIIYVMDTVNITTHDSTILGLDSVNADFNYVISYPSDSMSYATLLANDGSKNVPSDATYKWTIDGTLFIVEGQTYLKVSLEYSQNGPHILAMIITCPTKKKVYTVAKTFIIKLKG
jgi:hypothetical protein